MNYRHLWQSVKILPEHSYSAACTCMVASLTYYFLVNHFLMPEGNSIFQSFLYSLGLFAIFTLSAYAGFGYYRTLNAQDYKIGYQLHLLCFAILFILLMILLSSWLQNDFSSIRPYIYCSMAILLAIFFYAKRTIGSISTGHLFFGVIILSCISAFIPIGIAQSISKLIPLSTQIHQTVMSFLPSFANGQNYLLILSLLICFVMLYGMTAFYLKERVLYKESKLIFARFAIIIQILLLPLYFMLMPKIDGMFSAQSPAYQKFYLLSLAISSALCCIGLYAIMLRRQYWLNDANLLAKNIISPFILSAILIYLKIPNITITSFDVFFNISQQANNLYFKHWFVAVFSSDGDLLNYLPLLLAEILQKITQLNDIEMLINYSSTLMHSLLLILTFYALSRFLPFLFTFAILFMVPLRFPELLLLISYASGLFDRRLLESASRWSFVWFVGGVSFFILSPLYALFFLIGIIPYVIFTFSKFYRSNPRHTLNLLLIYGFAFIVIIFTPTMQILFHNILEFIKPNWLFNDNFALWGANLVSQENIFWQKAFFHLASPIWIIMLLVTIILLIPIYKKLAKLSQMSYSLGDWVLVSCGLTMVLSLPVLFNNLLGFDQSMTLTRFIYMIAFFGMPTILFRETLLFNKVASHLLCGVTLLIMTVYNFTIIPNFYDIFSL